MKKLLILSSVITILCFVSACSCNGVTQASPQQAQPGQSESGGQTAPTQSSGQPSQAGQPQQGQTRPTRTPSTQAQAVPTNTIAPHPTKTPQTQQQNPQPTSTATAGVSSNPPPLAGAYTLLTFECFDFNAASKVDCSSADADIWYTTQGPTAIRLIIYQNDLEMSNTFSSTPSKADCESAAYYPATYNLTEHPTTRAFCFKIPAGMASVTYGWFQPVAFNTELLSFNFSILGTGTAQGSPAIAPTQGEDLMMDLEQETLQDGKCYDLNTGATVSCSSVDADMKYTGADRTLSSVYSLGWGWYRDYAPDKDECMDMSFLSGFFYLNNLSLPEDYICFQLPSMENLYGWIRPTSMNSGGVTFDYVIFSP